MGLLICAKCGCSITAEMKKGKYVYYHCTNFRGECDNSYIRQEALADRLADVIKQIQISRGRRSWRSLMARRRESRRRNRIQWSRPKKL